MTDTKQPEALRSRCLHQIAEPASTAAQPPAGWWRQRADEIELEVAQGKSSAMRCYTDMRALLQAAAATKAAPQPSAQQGDALTYEQAHAIRQGHEIASSDAYFEARPQIDCNDRRNVFRAGFERGWDAARSQPVAQGDALGLERERICAAIKAEDDYCVDQGDYMLDSDDCIKIVRGEWVRPDFSIDAARSQAKEGASHD